MWKPEDILRKLVLSYLSVWCGHRTRVLRIALGTFTSWPTMPCSLLSFKGKIKEWPCLCPFSFIGLFIFL